MVARRYVPDAGDLVWLTFDPQAGHEQRGRRPALIVSPRTYNAAARLALACPITSHSKGYPFEVALPEGGEVTGVVLADHVKSLDWWRPTTSAGQLRKRRDSASSSAPSSAWTAAPPKPPFPS